MWRFSGIARVSGISRARSALGSVVINDKPAWMMAFVLRPRPDRAWQDLFEQVAWHAMRDGALKFDYLLEGDQHHRAYYDHVRAGLITRLRRRMRRLIWRRQDIVVCVTCPASEVHVQRAHFETQQLVAMVNEEFRRTRSMREDQDRARAAEIARLSRSLDALAKRDRRERRRSLWARFVGRSATVTTPASVLPAVPASGTSSRPTPEHTAAARDVAEQDSISHV
jgi:hypothetical protein